MMPQRNELTVPDLSQHQQILSGFAEENKSDGTRSSADMLAHPLNSNSEVLGDDIGTPAELAKAYMGSRPAKISSSVLGIRQQGGMTDIGLLGTGPFTSQTSVMSLPKKTSDVVADRKNGFVTPRSRGRSAIYDMARTPYFRNSAFKGSRNDATGNNVPSMPSTTLPSERSDEIFELQPMTLKRRSSVLENDVGSIGSIRRIRQKSNLLAPKIRHSNGLAVGSGTKQKLQLSSEPYHKALKAVGERETESVPRTSFTHVPSKSSEVAARIFQHLETLTPKEKSSESKLVAVRERSPMKFTSGLLSSQALRSMEAVDSPKLLTDSEHDHKLGDSPIKYCSFQNPRNVKENDPNASVTPAEVANNDPVVSFPGMPTAITTDVVGTGATHPPQKKRAFRMREPKDSMEHDDKTHYNGSAPKLSSVKMGTVEDTPTYGKSTPPEVPKSVKVTIPASEEAMATPQSVVVPFSTAAFKKPMELNNPSLFNSSSTIPTPSEVTATPPSVIVPFLSSAFKKPEDSTNSSSFSCISKSAEKFSALPSDYSKKLQPKVESTSSFVDVTASVGSQGKIPKSDRFGHVNPQAGDTNYKSVTVPHAEGQHVSISSPVSVTASASDAISSGGVLSFTSSTSISTVNPSSGTPSANNSGLAGNPSNFPGSLFKFGGTSVDPAVSIPNISEVSDTRTKVDIVPSSGSSSVSNSSATAPDVEKTESRMAGPGSSVSQPILISRAHSLAVSPDL